MLPAITWCYVTWFYLMLPDITWCYVTSPGGTSSPSLLTSASWSVVSSAAAAATWPLSSTWSPSPSSSTSSSSAAAATWSLSSIWSPSSSSSAPWSSSAATWSSSSTWSPSSYQTFWSRSTHSHWNLYLMLRTTIFFFVILFYNFAPFITAWRITALMRIAVLGRYNVMLLAITWCYLL